ncbi:hypothetical protein TKK_0000380 [Trichogramma kaykai]
MTDQLVEPACVDEQLRGHLQGHGILETGQQTCWTIDYSKLSGRGVIASRDVASDELVYEDAPVVQGPRCNDKYPPMCVACQKTGCALFPCDRGCGLPVCSDACQDDPRHRDVECPYLRELEPDCGSDWSLPLLQALVPVKALLLESHLKDIFYCFQSHGTPKYGREVDMLKKSVKNPLKPEDEEFMRLVCRVMDTNSFETAAIRADNATSLRALFPLGSLTNHQCVPNTRHLVDDRGHLLVYAVKPIARGQEITMSYADLLWDTTLRRQFLLATKYFSCLCSRCSDATETGSMLGALHCAHDSCPGKLLPNEPLDFNTNWACTSCQLVIKAKQIASIRAGISAAVEEFKYKSPRRMLRFIIRELSILVPPTNYVMMSMMFRIISIFGRSPGLEWSELTDEELDIKIQYCDRLIYCLDTLNCGDCTKKGLILYELHCANVEKMKRLSENETNQSDNVQNESILSKAFEILKNDAITPLDYREAYNIKTSVSCTI